MDSEHVEYLAELHRREWTQDVLHSDELHAFERMFHQLGSLVVAGVLDPTDAYEIRMRVMHGDQWYEQS